MMLAFITDSSGVVVSWLTMRRRFHRENATARRHRNAYGEVRLIIKPRHNIDENRDIYLCRY